MLSTKTQQRKLLGDVVLSLVLKTTYRRGKLGLLLVAQPKGAKATQKEDPQGSKNQAKPAQGRVFGFVSCVYGQFSGRVWPSSSRDGAGAAAKPQLHAVASPGRVSTPRTWVRSLQRLLKA